MQQCPGQDQRFWKPEDVFELACPKCKTRIEFWKDDLKRKCPGCALLIANPKLDLGCAKWCPRGDECLGQDSPVERSGPQAP